MFRGRAQKLHFVGIGGVGMSGIAEVLLTLGYDVSGSDLKPSATTRRLAAKGARIFVGHKASHAEDAHVVVHTSAVSKNNPELMQAEKLGIPVIPRAEMLAELMRLKYGIAVAGSHGKTTTTSLVAAILDAGKIDPTVVIGGRLKSLRCGARLGEGEYLVAEADESDGSFLRLMPTLAVVTNIDAEHLDHWQGGLAELELGFADFLNKVPFYGACVVCVDDPVVAKILPMLDKKTTTYGIVDDEVDGKDGDEGDAGPSKVEEPDFAAYDLRPGPGFVDFALRIRSQDCGRVRLGMVGKHNVRNALAALAVGDEVGVSLADAKEALSHFEGVGRRFELKGEVNDVLVVDDYGHHPTEIEATLVAAEQAYGRRLVVAFQPHRYSRTRDLFAEFSEAFAAADKVFVSDIYPAGEEPLAGISAEGLVGSIEATGHRGVHWTPSLGDLVDALHQHVEPGDLVLTLGAGSIGQVGDALLARLKPSSYEGRSHEGRSSKRSSSHERSELA